MDSTPSIELTAANETWTHARPVDPMPIRRLDPGARGRILTHFAALSGDDRRLRFGSATSPGVIAEYVDRIDFDRDALFGVFDDELAIVGLAHVALTDDGAELGISVLTAHRQRGIGSALLARCAEHARNRGIVKLYMHCLAENDAMMRIARRAGMWIVIEAGDADAQLALSPASPLSITGEILSDQLALFDYALKAQLAAWRTMTGVRRDEGADVAS